MQMENKINSQHYLFSNLFKNTNFKSDLLMYLYDNLYIENYDIFTRDIKTTLTINANG
jgi:hypothetical protein